LFSLLDGLPLAIAQAGAYLQESGVGLQTYLRFYEQQWEQLMETRDQNKAPLQDYPNRSIWTTWTISYNAIRQQDDARPSDRKIVKQCFHKPILCTPINYAQH
jgi:hypothetical protein